MLEQIREKAPRWLVSLILLLLVIPFALWGVNSYVQPTGGADAARVGGAAISVGELQQALRQEGQRLRQSLGDAYSPALMDNPEARRTVLDRLVNRELLAMDAGERRLHVSDATVLAVIQATDAFAGENGFDRARYESVLRRQGLTPAAFEADLKRSLALQQIQGGLADSAFISEAELDALAALWFERRDLRLATLEWQKFAPATAPDEAAITAYFNAHKAEFMTDEQVRLAYLELSLDAMASRLTVDDAMIDKRYEELKPELGGAEQRQARHILIRIPGDATPETVEQARKKADELRAQLISGADFAALAKAESADTGSAEQGGDLGYFERGSMTPAFEEAAFTLPLNTLSEPVRTPFGFHLIEVTAIRPSTAPPLAEIRDTLRQRVQRELAEEQFFAAAETLRTQSFEHPDTLAPAAQALDLKVQEIGPVSRRGGEGVAANPEFLRHAFSTEAIGGDNSEVFELGEGHYAVLRVLEHTPATQRPLEDVKTDITARLRQQEGAAAARAAGEALLARLRAGETVDTELTAHQTAFVDLPDVGREGKEGLSDAVLKKAFTLSVDEGKPGQAGIELDNGNYVIVAATARRPGPMATNAEARDALRRQLLTIRADQALTAQLAALRERHPVRILQATER
ncbi:MAG: SurA N-terminal domain-containing protein [Pseudomonadota bacterium]